MGKIVVFTNLTLDGVMQAPGRPDEDTRDGFQQGGWAVPFGAMQEAGDALGNLGAVLFGRRTYLSFYSFWANQPANPFTDFFNNTPKFVASRTLEEPLPWQNSSLLRDTLENAVVQLKEEEEKDIVVFGSGMLIQSLMRHNLVDRYVLLIHPLVLGEGHRLFIEGGATKKLRLIQSRTTGSGVVITVYEPAD